MIQRTLAKKLRSLAKKFPVISLTGPRQSGKTTLVKSTFPNYDYVSLENIEKRQQAEEDPKRFLKSFKKGVILDEVQRVPKLFSYIQGIVDEKKKMGHFILTGSQNFLLLEKITQSLAGRVSIQYLLPFSLEELKTTKHYKNDVDFYLFTGMYPAIYDRKLDTNEWYPSYITTYIERDVRQIKQIPDLNNFQRFMRLCAGRAGQLTNLSELGNECGISHTTAKSWLSILEASFIIFLLQPYYKNFNKRLVKQPKLYFYDTGLLCSLLNIKKNDDIKNHYARGAIFENFIISEIIKNHYHKGIDHTGYFWRDSRGNEIDYLIEKANHQIPIEIKSGETISGDYFKGLKYFQKITGASPKDSYVIYGGDENQKRKYGNVLKWSHLSDSNR